MKFWFNKNNKESFFFGKKNNKQSLWQEEIENK